MENNKELPHPTHRGFCQSTSEWVYGFYAPYHGEECITCVEENHLHHCQVVTGSVCRYLPYFDMYVGDVVQHPDFNNSFTLIDYGYKFVFRDNGTLLEYDVSMFYKMKDKLKVIGNIFENNGGKEK